MSQLYDLYVAHQSEAEQICDNPTGRAAGIDVSAFDEFKQMSLLSLFRRITIPKREGPSSSKSSKTLKSYHKQFKLLYPSELGKQRYVTVFPADLVQRLAEINEDMVASLAGQWMAVEPSFAEYNWTEQDVSELLKRISGACRTAIEEKKQVLLRFSL